MTSAEGVGRWLMKEGAWCFFSKGVEFDRVKNCNMEAKDLRIGNYFIPVMDDGTELSERRIKASEIFAIYNKPERGKGIPLTPEWLFKLGFTQDNDSWYFSLDFNPNSETLKIFGLTSGGIFNGMWGIVGMPLLCKKIEYVHQLQNLYRSLVGEDLKT